MKVLDVGKDVDASISSGTVARRADGMFLVKGLDGKWAPLHKEPCLLPLHTPGEWHEFEALDRTVSAKWLRY